MTRGMRRASPAIKLFPRIAVRPLAGRFEVLQVETKSLAVLLKAAVLAGLLGGFVAAGFHWIFTEPLIDRAVEMEQHLHGSPAVFPVEPVVSRPAQKLGLFIGFLLYGGAWGLLFGLLVCAIRPWFAEIDYGKQGVFLAVLLGWAVAIFPLLKYPANPPGVGELETIGYRQQLFLGFVALSLIGTVVALAFERGLRRTGRLARAGVIVAYAVCLTMLFLAFPSNPDPVRLPPGLVGEFRFLSLLGQFVFWTAMGGMFWWLCRKVPRAAPA
jgi:predicted cobalt transporter CbtA